VGKANGSREAAPDDKLRAPTTAYQFAERRCARRQRAFARPSKSAGCSPYCIAPDHLAAGDDLGVNPQRGGRGHCISMFGRVRSHAAV
jgi:hypothetical protein